MRQYNNSSFFNNSYDPEQHSLIPLIHNPIMIIEWFLQQEM